MSWKRSVSKRRSDRQYDFARVPDVRVPRSVFNRSCGIKTAFDSGYLVPIFVDEALPGDTFNLRMTLFGRLATPLHPIFDNMTMETFFFAVPIRLIWDNWEKFNGQQDDPGDSIDYVVPKMVAPAGTGYAEDSLSDYLGIPTTIASLEHSALWHRAYNLIYNEWFRPQDIVDSAVVDTGDADSDPADYPLRRRAKRHDYFTSCLPAPQKGASLPLPLGDEAPLDFGDATLLPVTGLTGSPTVDYGAQTNDALAVGNTGIQQVAVGVGQAGGPHALTWNDPQLNVTKANVEGSLELGFADLSAATAATINELRSSFQIQRMLEKDARGGTRYTEVIRSHFGVVSPDQRLQRPEYLGGGSQPVVINPTQNSFSGGSDPLGVLAGIGTVTGLNNGFSKSFVEHCVILGLVNVRADLNYQQGLPRMFSRRTRYDFYWPSLAHIGEQSVLRKEIFADGTANDDLVFGYQERYAEYRYKPSMVTGVMRSTAFPSLDTWHLAQEFLSAPVLDETFIEENPPVSRVVAVPSEPEFLLDGFAQFKCARPMPTYGVPGYIDHF